MCTTAPPQLVASPGITLWGQSQKLIEAAATSHLAENPFSNTRDWLCLHVESLLFCCAKHKWKWDVSESRGQLLDRSVTVTEPGLALRKCLARRQHGPLTVTRVLKVLYNPPARHRLRPT